VTCAAPASAVPPTESEATDLARMGAQLDLFADQASSRRTATLLTSLVVGAAFIPSGVYLVTRPDAESRGVGTGLIVTGGIMALLPLALTLPSTKVESLRRDFRARQAAGRQGSETLHSIEDEWRAAAASSRTSRWVGGAIRLVLGAGFLATGTVFLVAKPGIAGLSQSDQLSLGAGLLGPVIPFATVGFRSLFEPSLEEMSWQSYEQTRPPARAPSVGFAPTRGGTLAVVTLTF
jgi:hypothetical protein